VPGRPVRAPLPASLVPVLRPATAIRGGLSVSRPDPPGRTGKQERPWRGDTVFHYLTCAGRLSVPIPIRPDVGAVSAARLADEQRLKVEFAGLGGG
jgi:hypothetical protein